MPPKDDILDAVDRFNASYFQLGFLAKQQFRNKLRNDLRFVDPFLLLGILGISARMTPALITAHGSGVKAAEYFMDKQFDLATREIYMGPTLERCQAFYLLSLAQQGSGHKNASYVSLTRQETGLDLPWPDPDGPMTDTHPAQCRHRYTDVNPDAAPSGRDL
jgi:hypothetical protein